MTGVAMTGLAATGVPTTSLAITGAHVVPFDGVPFDGEPFDGEPFDGEPFDGTVLVTDGRIAALGPTVAVPDQSRVLDAGGRWLLPGFIDAHTHLGVHEEGEGWAGSDTNELTDPVTALVRALDAVNPADIGFDDALAGGITVANVNPVRDAIGGLTVAANTHGRTVDEMVLRSPSGLRSALGENPKRVYGDRKQTLSTRLGTRRGRRSSRHRTTWTGSPTPSPGSRLRQGISRTRRSAGCCAARSPGGSTRIAPTTSPPRFGSPTSSATDR